MMKRAHSPSPEKEDDHKKITPKRKQANDMRVHDSKAASFDIIVSETGLFRQVADFSHWKDAVALGAVNKDCRRTYIEIRDTILLPVLNLLETLFKSNIHSRCEEVCAPASQRVCTCSEFEISFDTSPENNALATLDPRYDDTYDTLPVHGRCERMTAFLTSIVSNLRLNLNLSDPSNPSNMPDAIGSLEDWSLGLGYSERAILRLYPRRAALSLNIALAKYCYAAMSVGLPGRDGIEMDPSEITAFALSIRRIFMFMLPLGNQDFDRFLREKIFPSHDETALLGPDLVSRVILCAPLLEWIDGNNNIILPEGLEPFEYDEACRAMREPRILHF